MKRIILLSIIIILPFLSLFAENGLFWEITGNGLKQPSYLFGTIHAICEDEFPVDKELLAVRLKSCKSLVLEADESKVGMVKMLKFTFMKGDTSLTQLLTGREYERLKQFYNDSLGMNLDGLVRMKPLLSGGLVIVAMLPCGRKEITSAEKILAEMAKKNKVKVRELEGFAYQAALIDSIPYAEQAKALLNMADSFTRYKTDFQNLLRAYAAGDLEALAAISGEEMKEGDFNTMNLLLDNRNERWVPQMEKIMAKDPAFVAVGAAHLAGENGLVQLLRNKGYTLTPILK